MPKSEEIAETLRQQIEIGQLAQANPTLSKLGRSLVDHPGMHDQELLASVNFAAVPSADLPLKHWREQTLKFAQQEVLEYDADPLGRQELRDALAGYLKVSKNIRCSPNEIATMNISLAGLDVLLSLLLNPGDVVAVEDAGKRAILVLALKQTFRDSIAISKGGGGLSLFVRFLNRDLLEVIAAARSAGLPVVDDTHGICIYFAMLTPDVIERCVREFGAALEF